MKYTISIILSIVVTSFVLMLVDVFGGRSFHIWTVMESGKEYYSVGSCRKISGCTIYGYRYSMTPEGLKEAQNNYDWFVNYEDGPTIKQVIQ